MTEGAITTDKGEHWNFMNISKVAGQPGVGGPNGRFRDYKAEFATANEAMKEQLNFLYTKYYTREGYYQNTFYSMVWFGYDGIDLSTLSWHNFCPCFDDIAFPWNHRGGEGGANNCANYRNLLLGLV